MEGYLGEIKLWSMDWAPRNWAFCAGQTMQISENTNLFSLIGTTYGGDGRVTFKLPDLSGRVPVGVSSFPHLGETFGDKMVSLTQNNLPAHHHGIKDSAPSNATANLKIYDGTANSNKTAGAQALSSAGSYDSGHGVTPIPMLSTSTPNAVLNNVVTGITSTLPSTTENTGEGEAFYNYQPSIGLHYIICVVGIFPDRP
jgi:microcystin-dependent protein